MGQHRIQKQILRNFSFEGRQRNSREIWCLTSDGYRPASRSIRRVGFFEVDCSEEVDEYITRLEGLFKESLRRFSHGEFARKDFDRPLYDFIALHYIRSQACRLQIRHMVDRFRQSDLLTQAQADTEHNRLTAHQDLAVFDDLVDSVSRMLTHFVVHPISTFGPWSFATSDKVMYVGVRESGSRETFVWFPLSPSAGLMLNSDGHVGQILGPLRVYRQLGRVEFAKVSEADVLRSREPSPQEIPKETVAILNGMMVQGSTQLYAAGLSAIGSALRASEEPTGYWFQPTIS